jgi:hypothetical protein
LVGVKEEQEQTWKWLTLGHNNTQQGFSEFTDNNQIMGLWEL